MQYSKCTRCRYFQNPVVPMTSIFGECRRVKPAKKGVILLNYDIERYEKFEFATDMRSPGGACGPDAVLFEPEPSPLKRFLNVHTGTLVCFIYLTLYVLTLTISIEIISTRTHAPPSPQTFDMGAWRL